MGPPTAENPDQGIAYVVSRFWEVFSFVKTLAIMWSQMNDYF
jgi:hypothetical protein